MAWQPFFAVNRRSTRMAELWVRDLLRYLLDNRRLGPSASVLDFGCGYFDVGLALADRVGRMDGLEIDEHSLSMAESRTRSLPQTTLFRSNDDVPTGTYDLILANSVFQYLGSDDAIGETLHLFKTWLKSHDRGEVLLVDLIPHSYSPPLDAIRSLQVAARHGVLPAMTKFIWNAAFNRAGLSLHRIDAPRLAELAQHAGFSCTVLGRNLTPSRQRYSCLLRAER